MNLIIRNYFIVTIGLLILVPFYLASQPGYIVNGSLFAINVVAVLAYILLLLIAANKGAPFYRTSTLVIMTLIYTLLFFVILKYFYYYNHGDLFPPGSVDSYFYQDVALQFNKYSAPNIIKMAFSTYNSDDCGAIVLTSLLYKVYPSPISLDIFNYIMGILSAAALFRLGLLFMSRKYSFICSLTYYCSSFAIQSGTSGLKEPAFALIVILCFFYFYKYIREKKIKFFLCFLILCLLTPLFRLPVFGFVLLSCGAGFIILGGKSIKKWIYVVLAIVGVIYFVLAFSEKLVQLSVAFDTNVANDIAGSDVAAITAFIAGLIGPLPTIIPLPDKEVASVYSVGLLWRVLTSIFFYYGLIRIVKDKVRQLYPLIAFTLLEIVSLIYIMESLELRYHLLHLPFVYLIVFYYLFDRNSTIKSRSPGSIGTSRMSIIFNIWSLLVFGLLFIWNTRFF